MYEPDLFGDTASAFPSTRYQGSKVRLIDWILDRLAPLEFETVLDGFGGTGVVGWHLKRLGKAVTYNDALEFNRRIGAALIENDGERLAASSVEALLAGLESTPEGFISQTFRGIYFTDDENRWLDGIVPRIDALGSEPLRNLAFAALCQACLIKRPYNLFHRRNLDLRTRSVARSFGNKASWDRPFPDHFRRFAAELSGAVFEGRRLCRSVSSDIAEISGDFDLVYLDPPYLPARTAGVDYRRFYHFLEGLTDLSGWPERVDHQSRHLELQRVRSPWNDRSRVHRSFEGLFERFAGSTLVVSYRSDGTPTIDELIELLRGTGRRVEAHQTDRIQYALSKNRRSREVLLVAR